MSTWMLARKKQESQIKSWSVILTAYPRIGSRTDLFQLLASLFPLSVEEAEEVVSHVPIVLLEGVALSLATELKKRLAACAAEVLITQDSALIRKCSKASWQETPKAMSLQEETETPADSSETPEARETTEDPPRALEPEEALRETQAEAASTEDHSQKISALENTNLDLEESLREQLRKAQEWRAKFSVVDEQLRAQIDANGRLQLERDEMESRTVELTGGLESLVRKHRELSDVKQELEQKTGQQASEIAALAEELAKSQKFLEEASARSQSAEQSLEQEKGIASERAMGISDVSRDNQSLRESQAALTRRTAELEETCRNFAERTEDLERTLEDRNRLIAEQEAQNRQAALLQRDSEHESAERGESLKSLEAQMAALEVQLSEAQELARNHRELSEAKEELDRKAAAQASEIIALGEELEKLRREHEESAARSLAAQRSLEQEKELAAERAAEISAVSRENQSLESSRASLARQTAELEESCRILSEHAKVLEQSLRERDRLIADHETQAREAALRQCDLERESGERGETLQALETQVEALEGRLYEAGDLARNCQELTDAKQELEQKAASQASEIAALGENLAQSRRDLEESSARGLAFEQNLEQEKARGCERATEISAVRRENQALRESQGTLANRMAELEDTCRNFAAHAQTLERSLEERDRLIAEQGAQSRQAALRQCDLEHESAERAASLKLLEAQLEALEAALSEAQDLVRKHGELSAAKEALDQKAARQAAEIDSLGEELAKLRREQEEASERSLAAAREREEERAQAIERAKDLLAATRENEALKASQQTLAKRTIGLEENCRNLGVRAEALEQSLEERHRLIFELEAQSRQAAQREREMTRESAVREESLKDLESQIEAMEVRLREAQALALKHRELLHLKEELERQSALQASEIAALSEGLAKRTAELEEVCRNSAASREDFTKSLEERNRVITELQEQNRQAALRQRELTRESAERGESLRELESRLKSLEDRLSQAQVFTRKHQELLQVKEELERQSSLQVSEIAALTEGLARARRDLEEASARGQAVARAREQEKEEALERTEEILALTRENQSLKASQEALAKRTAELEEACRNSDAHREVLGRSLEERNRLITEMEEQNRGAASDMIDLTRENAERAEAVMRLEAQAAALEARLAESEAGLREASQARERELERREHLESENVRIREELEAVSIRERAAVERMARLDEILASQEVKLREETARLDLSQSQAETLAAQNQELAGDLEASRQACRDLEARRTSEWEEMTRAAEQTLEQYHRAQKDYEAERQLREALEESVAKGTRELEEFRAGEPQRLRQIEELKAKAEDQGRSLELLEKELEKEQDKGAEAEELRRKLAKHLSEERDLREAAEAKGGLARQEAEDFRARTEELTVLSGEMAKQVSRLEEELGVSASQWQKMEQEKRALLEAIDSRDGALSRLNTEIESMRTKVEALEAKSLEDRNGHELIAARLKDAEKRLLAISGEREQLHQDVRELTRQHHDLEEEIQRREEALRQAREQAEFLNRQFCVMEAERDAECSRRTLLDTKLAGMKSDLEKSTTLYCEATDRLHNLEELRGQLEAELERREGIILGHQQGIARLEDEKAGLMGQAEQLRAANEAGAEARRDVEAKLAAEAAGSDKALREQEQRIAELDEELERRSAALREHQQRAARLEEEKAGLTGQVEHYVAAHEEETAARREAEEKIMQAASELERMKASQARQSEQVLALEEDRRKLEAGLAERNEAYQGLARRIAELDAELERRSAALREHQQSAVRLEEEKAGLVGQTEHLLAVHEEETAARREAEAKIMQAASELAQMKSSQARQSEQVLALEEVRRKLEAGLAERNEAYQGLARRIAELDEELERRSAALREHQQRAARLEEEKARLVEQTENLLAAHEGEAAARQEAEEKIMQAASELERMKASQARQGEQVLALEEVRRKLEAILAERNEAHQERAQQIAELDAELERRSAALREHQQSAVRLEEEKAGLAGQVEHLLAAHEGDAAARRELEAKIMQAATEIDAVKASEARQREQVLALEEVRRKLEAILAERNGAHQERARRIAELDEELDRRSAALLDHQRRAALLEEENAGLVAQVENLLAANEGEETFRREIEAKFKDAAAEIDRRGGSVREQQQTIVRLEEEKDGLLGQVERLLAAHEAETEARRAVEEKLTETASQLESLRESQTKQMEQSQAMDAACRKLEEELAERDWSLRERRQKISEIEEELERRGAALREHERGITRLEEEKAGLLGQVENLLAAHEGQTSGRQAVEAKLLEAVAETEKMTGARWELEARCQELEALRHKLEEDLTARDEEIRDQGELVNLLTGERNSLRAEKERLEKSAVLAERKELETRINEIIAGRDAANASIEELTVKQGWLDASRRKLEEDLAQRETALQERALRIAALEEELGQHGVMIRDHEGQVARLLDEKTGLAKQVENCKAVIHAELTARRDFEAKLTEATVELDHLRPSHRSLAAARQKLEEDMKLLTAERDRLNGQLQERSQTVLQWIFRAEELNQEIARLKASHVSIEPLIRDASRRNAKKGKPFPPL